MREKGRLDAASDLLFESRLTLLALAIVAVFALFGLRLVQFQLIEGQRLTDRSVRNSIRTLRLEPPRGDILDRRGNLLATTRPAFAVQVIPSELQRSDVTYEVLGRLLGRGPDELAERVGSPSGRARYQPVALDSDLSFESLARIESHRFALPGVVTAVRARRHYQQAALAAHLLGTLGQVTRSQLESEGFEGYSAGEIVGQSGIEARFERHLRGSPGGRNVMVDVAGREVEILDEVKAVPGGTVVLALDMELQRAAEAAFAELGHRAGALVALDPRNGDVLAMVSMPTYDPDDFVTGIDEETWAALRDDPEKPLQNRVYGGQYPPGSVYKAIIAAAALEDGVIGPHTRAYCPGSFKLGRRTYRCWRREGHGSVDLRQALKESCDVFFYQTGLKLGIDRIAWFARGFNLGRRTGIDLPGERAGLIPTTDWKERRFEEPWIKGETVSASIGQGFDLTTPLQLAVAYGAIANGGTIYEPRLVLRLIDHDGGVVLETAPGARGQVPVRPEYLHLIRDGLVAAVEERGGTGGRARVPGVTVAGKTGTAQVVSLNQTEHLDEDEIAYQHRDHAWFAAFAPAEAPEIVVVALAEHGGHGGSAAAPLAQRVLARYFERAREREAQRLAVVSGGDGDAGN